MREWEKADAVFPDGFIISNQWPLRDKVELVPVHASFPKNLQRMTVASK
jgi:hypothetical protein